MLLLKFPCGPGQLNRPFRLYVHPLVAVSIPPTHNKNGTSHTLLPRRRPTPSDKLFQMLWLPYMAGPLKRRRTNLFSLCNGHSSRTVVAVRRRCRLQQRLRIKTLLILGCSGNRTQDFLHPKQESYHWTKQPHFGLHTPDSTLNRATNKLYTIHHEPVRCHEH